MAAKDEGHASEDFEFDRPSRSRQPARYRSEAISTFQELSAALIDARLRGWVFRGQRCPDWSLTTVLERAIPDGEMRNLFEPSILEDFQRLAHHHLQAQAIPENELEWLALLQHYGGPTRLQDWTAAPLVALFFAIEQKTEADCYVVWGADAGWLEYTSRDLVAKALNVKTSQAAQLIACARHNARALWRVLHSRAEAVVVLSPWRQSERLTIQQGRFLVPCDIGRPFMDNWPQTPSRSPTLVRFEIRSDLRFEVLEYLRKVNISRATLFPGLDGLAQSLHHYSLYRTIDEVEVSNIKDALLGSSIVTRLLAPWDDDTQEPASGSV